MIRVQGETNTFTLDELERSLLDRIKAGEQVTSEGSREVSYALTRLRRNGIIENHGSRGRPDWQPSDLWRYYTHHMTIIFE